MPVLDTKYNKTYCETCENGSGETQKTYLTTVKKEDVVWGKGVRCGKVELDESSRDSEGHRVCAREDS